VTTACDLLTGLLAIAGDPTTAGTTDATGLSARFQNITDMAWDRGNWVYILDDNGTVSRIRRMHVLTQVVQTIITLAHRPQFLAVGPVSGHVFFASAAGGVSRVDPNANTPTEIFVTGVIDYGARAVTFNSDETAMFVTHQRDAYFGGAGGALSRFSYPTMVRLWFATIHNATSGLDTDGFSATAVDCAVDPTDTWVYVSERGFGTAVVRRQVSDGGTESTPYYNPRVSVFGAGSYNSFGPKNLTFNEDGLLVVSWDTQIGSNVYGHVSISEVATWPDPAVCEVPALGAPPTGWFPTGAVFTKDYHFIADRTAIYRLIRITGGGWSVGQIGFARPLYVG
jgi:hypothetical protein